MLDSLMDGLIDSIKLLPYLFVTFLILELIEHKLGPKTEKVLEKGNKFGPIIGGIFGALPQCGFSTMASNLFSGGVITMGTLVAVFLSTSDEMLPIMLSEKYDFKVLLGIVGFKVLIGIICGFVVDIIYRKKKEQTRKKIHDHCEHDKCHCEEQGIFKSSLIHTLKVFIFILIINIVLNILIESVGEDALSHLLYHKNILSYFIASMIGLVPNCASSVLITELYLSKVITLGTLLSGLLTGSGLGILFLFKENKNKKENIAILFTIYGIGVIVGFIVDLII